MDPDPDPTPSRRDFVADLGRAALLTPLAARVSGPSPNHADRGSARSIQNEWDLSWIERLAGATDRAIFDWATMGEPGDPIVLEIAARYLDNCAAVYRTGTFRPGVVINIRTTATAAALSDDLWARFGLATDSGAVDPETNQPARRNPFLRRAANAIEGIPDLTGLMARGAIVLVCDFALGHIATRLGQRLGRPADDVHRELREGRVPGSFIVPSGIFGLARAQNAGCAFIRM
jgi:hypothetical protein